MNEDFIKDSVAMIGLTLLFCNAGQIISQIIFGVIALAFAISYFSE